MNEAIRTSFKKSFDSMETISPALAPSTFLTPISFARCSAAKVINPSKPRQAIKIARTENVIKIIVHKRIRKWLFRSEGFKFILNHGNEVWNICGMNPEGYTAVLRLV